MSATSRRGEEELAIRATVLFSVLKFNGIEALSDSASGLVCGQKTFARSCERLLMMGMSFLCQRSVPYPSVSSQKTKITII
jgi:hypothetical protein